MLDQLNGSSTNHILKKQRDGHSPLPQHSVLPSSCLPHPTHPVLTRYFICCHGNGDNSESVDGF